MTLHWQTSGQASEQPDADVENVWPGGGPWCVTAGGDIKPHKTRHHADFHLALRMSLSWVRQQGIEEDGTAGIIREREKKKKNDSERSVEAPGVWSGGRNLLTLRCLEGETLGCQ